MEKSKSGKLLTEFVQENLIVHIHKYKRKETNINENKHGERIKNIEQ